MSLNNGTGYRSMEVVRLACSRTEASFSPLDTAAIAQDMALRGSVGLCGYSFGLKGSQAALTQNAAFGHFTRALSSLDAVLLGEVLPAFHHLGSSMSRLRQAINADSSGRLQHSRDWAGFALSQESLLTELDAISPNMPLRICHNDTKLNNMLFDSRDMSSLAIIDLDTCMPGHLLYDFGDMVRSFCSPWPKTRLSSSERVSVREESFAAFCRGYLGELGGVLTPVEKQILWLGARVMCFMVRIRFLTDYLLGDGYFKVQNEHHNLQRSANQLMLYRSLLAKQDWFRVLLE